MEIILSILGGLGLFLFAVSRLGETMHSLMGERSKRLIGKFVRNTFTAVLTGLIVTILLDSSSAVIILTIVLVNANVLTFRQAMGIVIGANIGTTFSSQLIALDVGKFSPIPIIVGLFLAFFTKNENLSHGAKALLYFGILFFGLFTMERAVEPLKDNAYFGSIMSQLDNRFAGAAAGAFVTLVIQSSSATVGIVITFAKKGLIALPGAIAVMLGAELGTCADTLLATIKSNKQALKTGLFHLSFNIISIIIGLLCFPWFVALVQYLSGGVGLEQKVANAHILFNVSGAILFLPFVRPIERLLNKLVPDKKGEVEHLDPFAEEVTA
ncbi:MAG: Na/Pi cotransporter family protein [Sphingobacteriales bacterium]|nr:MAG: Na/Pi cotransporter family protein [Sphingobacteriales bacterium]